MEWELDVVVNVFGRQEGMNHLLISHTQVPRKRLDRVLVLLQL